MTSFYYYTACSNYYEVTLGGTDKDNEDTWKWLDGTPWNFLGWAGGEPNHMPGDGDMVRMRKGKNDPKGRAWYDGDRNADYAFLCASDECPERKPFWISFCLSTLQWLIKF